jgi:heat shock protein HtpX
MDEGRSSLYWRALFAFALWLGFYALALGVIAALGALTWLQFATGRVHPYLVFLSGMIVFFLVAAILPRRDPFVAPGLRLEPADHPRLFEEIHAVARSTDQPIPDDVYLIHEANAWVSMRGPFWRPLRVLALGHPLVHHLTENELRAVLAHEFAHWAGGDTWLTPWVWHTRQALSRTLDALSGNLLDFLFIGYAKLFMRVTNAISRQQELDADRLAARLVGGESLVAGLKKISTLAPGHDHYWHSEVVPLLDAGFLPPLADGFTAYFGNPFIQKIARQALDDELRQEDPDAWDTHPPLSERIRNVHAFVSSGPRNRPEPAAGWLGAVPDLERRLLSAAFPTADVETLTPLPWEKALERVYLPGYVRTAREHADDVAGLRLRDLREWVADPSPLVERFSEYVDASWPREQVLAQLGNMFGPLITAVLVARGIEALCVPGEPVSLRAPWGVARVFQLFTDLDAGELVAAKWVAWCEEIGVGDADLGALCRALPDPGEPGEPGEPGKPGATAP